MGERNHVIYVDSGRTDGLSAGFRDAGIAVEHVRTRKACLERLERSDLTWDALITEHDLGDETGIDLCRELQARGVDIPIFLYTDAGNEVLAGEAIAAGAAGYVPKSQGVPTLLTRVLDVLFAGESPRAAPTADSEVDDSLSTIAEDGYAESRTPHAPELTDRSKRVFDQSPLAIIEWNTAFEIEHWNSAATELFGYSEAEAVGESASELLIPPDKHDNANAWWDNWLEGAPTQSHGISRNLDRNGTELRCEWYNIPLTDGEGAVESVLSFARDVTTEFRRSRALETLQETTRTLMETSSETEIGELVIEATDSIIKGALAGIRLYDEDENALEIVAASERLEAASGDLTRIEPGDGPLWEGYNSGESVIIDDAAPYMVPYDLDSEVGNAVIYPLGDHGLLTVASSGGLSLENADINLIQVLAATAESALDRAARERELQRKKTVIETVGDSVYALDTDGRFVTVNDTLTAMTGYTRDELLGEHVSMVLEDRGLERAQRAIQTLIESDSGAVETYDVTVVTKAGERIPCEVNTTVRKTEGEIAGSVGIVRDVSDRKLMERELIQQQAKMEKLHEIASRLEECTSPEQVYELTVETAEDVLEFDVCVVDSVQDGYLVTEAVSSDIHDDGYSNRTTVDDGIAGKTYRTGETYRVDDLDTDEDASPEREGYQSVLSVPVGTNGVFQAVSTDPSAFNRDDQELTELLLSHVTNALDRLAFESRLKNERDQFAALFENVPDAVVSTQRTPEGPIVERANPAFERIFGYEEAELVEEPLDQFIVPPQLAEEAAEFNMRGNQGEPVEAEVKRQTVDGLRDFMMRVVPIEMNEHSDRAFGLYTDITEQKQRQKRVEILNRVLRHDLRNGMNIINGCAEMLADAVEDTEKETFAVAIQERAGELISLAEKTRAVERTLDHENTTTGPLDVIETTEDAIDRLEREYPTAQLSYSLPDRLYVRANDLLEDAIFHVLENAAEHNDRCEPQIDVSVETSENDDESVIISITDDGPGLPEEERALLQEEQEITQLRHASGLGLWLVNWVVTQSGGHLTFHDRDPRGTVVALEIPKSDIAQELVRSNGRAVGD
ncbi:PAS domain S-box protein [Halobacteria archaeon AArc-curdl1]|uniref:histidine kinase n=1 Tax=Natronosalvus hydrolyticus TaxID=2979988 RepID=A0AAP2Z798_9EURY|nr:PAS domain S-box protein [Halobacteria archaeon AArc-curdl1]